MKVIFVIGWMFVGYILGTLVWKIHKDHEIDKAEATVNDIFKGRPEQEFKEAFLTFIEELRKVL